MTIGSIISLVIGGIVLLVGVGVAIWRFIEQDTGMAIGVLIFAIIFGAILIVSPIDKSIIFLLKIVFSVP